MFHHEFDSAFARVLWRHLGKLPDFETAVSAFLDDREEKNFFAADHRQVKTFDLTAYTDGSPLKKNRLHVAKNGGFSCHIAISKKAVTQGYQWAKKAKRLFFKSFVRKWMKRPEIIGYSTNGFSAIPPNAESNMGARKRMGKGPHDGQTSRCSGSQGSEKKATESEMRGAKKPYHPPRIHFFLHKHAQTDGTWRSKRGIFARRNRRATDGWKCREGLI